MLALLGRRACLLAQQGCAVRRGVTSTAAAHDLRAFLDVELSEDEQPTYGRAWQASELRLKSWSDLHKLWYVCLKERNMLDTQVHWHKAEEDRQKQEEYVHRYRQVKLTMNRIKQVLSERACQELNPVKQSQMKKAIHLM